MVKPSHRKVEQGFSLVELMVALVIGLLIMLGATQLFITGKQTFHQSEQMGKRQETLRYLVDVISQDIRMADSLANDFLIEGGMKLTYQNTRNNDPYCGGVSDLTKLEYYQDPDVNSLKVKVFCDGAETPDSDQAIISGIEKASFKLSPEPIGTSDFRVYVDITFSLKPIDGVADEVTFRVTNRRSAVARLD